jgi:hypothetical protein
MINYIERRPPEGCRVLKNSLKYTGLQSHSVLASHFYLVLMGIPEGKWPVARPRHRSEDNRRKGKEGKAWTVLIGLKVGTTGGLL